MANGDVLAATVIASDPYNGWILEVTLEGLAGQTAATVAFGYASENTPSATTPYIDLTTEGYVGTTLGTHSMRIYLTDVIRKPYPDNASQDIRDSGSDIIVRVALSDYVYNDDTAVTFTAPAGWLVVGATSAGAASALAVTNSSTQDYPQAFMTWTMLPFMRQSGDFSLSCIGRCIDRSFCCYPRFSS